MEGIPLNEETLNQFQQEYEGDNTGGPDAEPDMATKQLNEAATWILKTVDSALQQTDERFKTDEKTLKLYSELSVLCAKRNFSDAILRNSPEFFWATITAGLITEKLIIYNQIKNEAPPSPSEPKTQDENEGADG